MMRGRDDLIGIPRRLVTPAKAGADGWY